jgi:hypothetical protein
VTKAERRDETADVFECSQQGDLKDGMRGGGGGKQKEGRGLPRQSLIERKKDWSRRGIVSDAGRVMDLTWSLIWDKRLFLLRGRIVTSSPPLPSASDEDKDLSVAWSIKSSVSFPKAPVLVFSSLLAPLWRRDRFQLFGRSIVAVGVMVFR